MFLSSIVNITLAFWTDRSRTTATTVWCQCGFITPSPLSFDIRADTSSANVWVRERPCSTAPNLRHNWVIYPFLGTVLFDWKSPRPHLCSKLALFKTSWQMFKVLLCYFFDWSANGYCLGLSNKPIFIIIAHRAAKLWPIKVGDLKKIRVSGWKFTVRHVKFNIFLHPN